MSSKLRLDRILANMGYGSRRQVRNLIKRGAVKVNGDTVTNKSHKVDPTAADILVNGEQLDYREFIYLVMNKPAGVVSSTDDPLSETVIDLLPPAYSRFEPFPVGRLDKDTEGLMLLTNDGQLAHDLLSPRKHVAKRYFAEIDGEVTHTDVRKFASGLDLGDFVAMPAELKIIHSGPISEVEVTIYEGKHHQIKRMFSALGKTVLYLQRTALGPLRLDPDLEPGHFRELTAGEKRLLGLDG